MRKPPYAPDVFAWIVFSIVFSIWVAFAFQQYEAIQRYLAATQP